MIGLYRIIKDDLFGIAKRLRELDKDYFVVYSYKNGRYEIHNRGNRGNTFCFAADVLDQRVIMRARKTRRERIDKLLSEMERENARCREAEKEQTVHYIERETEKILSRWQ